MSYLRRNWPAVILEADETALSTESFLQQAYALALQELRRRRGPAEEGNLHQRAATPPRGRNRLNGHRKYRS